MCYTDYRPVRPERTSLIRTVEFLSVCLVHRLKAGVQTWGYCTNLTPVLIGPTINSIGVFAIGYWNHIAGELLALLAYLTTWMKAQDVHRQDGLLPAVSVICCSKPLIILETYECQMTCPKNICCWRIHTKSCTYFLFLSQILSVICGLHSEVIFNLYYFWVVLHWFSLNAYRRGLSKYILHV